MVKFMRRDEEDGGVWFVDDHEYFISPELVQAILEHCAAPGLTPEQLAVAQAEAVLEEAVADGIIQKNWQCESPSHEVGDWRYWLRINATHIPFYGKTRLAAAQAAVARVDELRAEAEKKKLPEPEEMDETAKVVEIIRLGFTIGEFQGLPMLYRNGERVHFAFSGRHCTLSDALRRARELAQD